jgi:hypothetical protein
MFHHGVERRARTPRRCPYRAGRKRIQIRCLRSGLTGRAPKTDCRRSSTHTLSPNRLLPSHEPAHTPVYERLLNVLWTCWAGSTSVVISRPANGQRPGQRGNFLAGPAAYMRLLSRLPWCLRHSGNFLAGPAAYMRAPLNATASWVCEFGIVTHWLNELHPGSPWMLTAYLSIPWWVYRL